MRQMIDAVVTDAIPAPTWDVWRWQPIGRVIEPGGVQTSREKTELWDRHDRARGIFGWVSHLRWDHMFLYSKITFNKTEHGKAMFERYASGEQSGFSISLRSIATDQPDEHTLSTQKWELLEVSCVQSGRAPFAKSLRGNGGTRKIEQQAFDLYLNRMTTIQRAARDEIDCLTVIDPQSGKFICQPMHDDFQQARGYLTHPNTREILKAHFGTNADGKVQFSYNKLSDDDRGLVRMLFQHSATVRPFDDVPIEQPTKGA